MSTPFAELLSGLKQAVVQASREMQQQQLSLIERYFDWVSADSGETSDADGPPAGDVEPPWRGRSGRGSVEGHWTPKLARFDLPVEDGPGGARVKEIYVPLISLVPQNALTIDEVRVVTEIELTLLEDVENHPEVRVSTQSESLAERGAGRKMLVEVVIRGDDAGGGMDALIEAYTKSVKQQLP